MTARSPWIPAPGELRVWAPRAGRVEAVLAGGARLELGRERPGASGWFSLRDPSLRAGVDYAFSLDGGPPRPDPRSGWQPHGVHGPSRLVDHAAFAWTDGAWQPPPLASGLLYELHLGTFTPEGTFEAAIERLEHLRALGVTHVELMPVAAFPGRHGWGYDGVALYAPHAPYGGPDGLKRLVDACHARGLAVLLDVVYNHLGPDGNYLGQFGPYFTDAHRTPWGAAVNLEDAGSDEVRRFFCDDALMWLRDYHLDGLRVDAVHAFFDRSAVHFVEQLAAEVEELSARLGRHLVVIAESDLNDPRVVTPREAGGWGAHAQWSDDFHHALHAVLTGERTGYYEDFGQLGHLARALERAFVYAGERSEHRRRSHGRAVPGLSGHRFVAFTQNHDQVGNRARGERLCHLVSPGRARVAAALLLTGPFVPMLFQGEEWAASGPFRYFTDHEDPALARAVSEGRRSEFASFGWDPERIDDPQDPATVAASRLDWDEPTRPGHADVLAWYRDLIRLRAASPDLRDGRLDRVRVRLDEAARWLVVERTLTTVAVNLGVEPHWQPLAPDRPGRLLLRSSEGVRVEGDGVRLPPDSVAILGV